MTSVLRPVLTSVAIFWLFFTPIWLFLDNFLTVPLIKFKFEYVFGTSVLRPVLTSMAIFWLFFTPTWLFFYGDFQDLPNTGSFKLQGTEMNKSFVQ